MGVLGISPKDNIRIVRAPITRLRQQIRLKTIRSSRTTSNHHQDCHQTTFFRLTIVLTTPLTHRRQPFDSRPFVKIKGFNREVVHEAIDGEDGGSLTSPYLINRISMAMTSRSQTIRETCCEGGHLIDRSNG